MYPLKQYKFERAVLAATDITSFDLIHSHTLFNGGWAAYCIYKKHKIPYVVTVRNTDLNDYLKWPFSRYIARKIIKKASGILFLSISYRDSFFKKIYGKDLPKNLLAKTQVIPNGLEDFWHQNSGNPKASIHQPLRFLCVGKIDTNKNILCILQAMDILKQQGIESSLTVIGQVVDQPVYEVLKDNRNVILVNYLTKEELLKYYRESDIFIMPSIFESFGRVYAEAMSQGLPVIYSQGQGFDGLFPEGCVGYHVPAKDPAQMALVTKKILENYSAISSKCIEKSALFNWNDIAKKLQDFYKNVCSGERE